MAGLTINTAQSVNAQVSVTCHELAHALVRHDRHDDDPTLGYAEEELVAESVVFCRVDANGGVDAGRCVGDGCHRRPTGYWMWPASRSASSSSPVVKTSRLATVRSLSCDQTGRPSLSARATVGQSSGSRAAMRCSASAHRSS